MKADAERIKPVEEFDSPWKEAVEKYFRAFMQFFFPRAHDAIDWTRRPVFLDKELKKIMRGAKLGAHQADTLVKVWLKNGGEQWIIIHVEAQGTRTSTFTRRMFTYYYRAFDKHETLVASFAIIAD